MAGKCDFRKTLDSYRATGAFRILDVPALQYLMVDGHGDPNTAPAYEEALKALYPVAYKLKFASKQELGRYYVVPPLEGLWWAEDLAAFTSARDKSRWDWTMMLMVPDWLGPAEFRAAVERVGAKDAPASLGAVRLEPLAEGTCVQVLHVGPYDDEAAVLEELHHRFLPENGLRPSGKHHEIYLGDPRRAAPEKLRTILRQPVVPTA
ncbi:GyrI-like domain-containing protein [Zafaria sp. J156]|uniref:GyrI-like domain-containing protein n=1 Tax=Zafaria sp. J156 TaxID=3116490 RepID=UPI002E77AF39|nr:GyrI-like domain-containing protein [Zafaria sp. J156]MEE1622561.1 GyrI-like domain-containing protein [Zafaria sp. J156]